MNKTKLSIKSTILAPIQPKNAFTSTTIPKISKKHDSLPTQEKNP